MEKLIGICQTYYENETTFIPLKVILSPGNKTLAFSCKGWREKTKQNFIISLKANRNHFVPTKLGNSPILYKIWNPLIKTGKISKAKYLFQTSSLESMLYRKPNLINLGTNMISCFLYVSFKIPYQFCKKKKKKKWPICILSWGSHIITLTYGTQ